MAAPKRIALLGQQAQHLSCSRIIRAPPATVGLTRCSQAQRTPQLPGPCRGHVECSCSRRLPLHTTMRIVCNDSLAADNKRCSSEAAFVLLSRYLNISG
jgi:hypothetical protein